jgi:hypothetical protein
MASKTELEAIIKLSGNVSPSLRKAMMDANQRFNALGDTSSRVGKLMSSAFSFAAKGAAIGAVAIGAGLMLVAKQGLSLASDLTEVQNVVDVTFGGGSKQIDAWSKTTLESYGLGELAAKQYSSTLGSLMKSSGISSDHLLSMSKNLTALSGDMASFKNLKAEEAFDKIRAGISGETEPLKQLGIDMSVANLEAFALSKGIKTAFAKMSQGDKTMVRYNYLLAQTGDMQGDFAKTIDSYANQKKLFAERWKDLSKTIMTNALPAFTKIMNTANELVKNFANSPEKIQKLQDAIGRAADKAIELLPIAIGYTKDFVGFLGQVYDGAKQVYQFLSDNWSLIKPLLLGVVGAMVAWKVAMGVMKAYNAVVIMGTFYIKGLKWAYSLLHIAKLKDVAITLYLQSLYAKDAIVKAASTVATWAMTVATGAWNIAAGIGAAVTTAFGVAMAILTSPITLVILAIAALGVGIYFLIKYWDNVIAAMKGAWEWFTNLINKIPDLALVLTGPLAPLLLLIKHFEKVKDIASGAFGAVKKFFGFGGDDNGSVDLSSVPKYARGGFANQPSIFGEAGPEAAIPLKRTPRSLSLLSKTAEALGVGGGGKSESGGTTFVYSPTYGSGTSESQVKQDFEDFKAMCEKWMESRRRESFA